MKLTNIALENFRCFERLELSLHPRLTVFVAENGGGKTSILDAIARGLSPVVHLLTSANQRLSAPGLEDTDFLLKEDKKSDYVKIKLRATDSNTTGDNTLEWDMRKKQHQNIKTEENIGQKQISDYAAKIFNQIENKTNVSESQRAQLPVFAYYGASRGHIDIPLRLRSKKNETNYGYPTSALLSSLESLPDFREMLKWFKETESSELRSQRESQTHSLTDKALDDIRNTIEKLFEKRYVAPRFNSRGKFVINEAKTNTELQVLQLSQGYQSMLALAMDFSRRIALAKQPTMRPEGQINSIMLVDEIDLHLHPAWQQRVIPDLLRAFPNTQFIVTTHSPQVLTTVENENIRLIKQDDEGNWTALPPQTPQVYGVESAIALANIQGVNPIPPVDKAAEYSEFIAIIENGTPESEARKEQLRKKLTDFYGTTHPLILDAERLERFQSFKLSRHNNHKHT